MIVSLDFETRSRFDVRRIPSTLYAKSLTELLCCAYRIGGQSVRVWRRGDSPPVDLFEAIHSGAELHAFNAAFERAIWTHHCVPKLGWPEVPFDAWHCSAAQAGACALPRSLDQCGRVLKLSTLKDQEGKDNMQRMCRPRQPTQNNPSEWHEEPERWERLLSYCADDVLAEQAIDRATPKLSELERQVWLLDQKINDRGVAIDVQLAQGAINVWNKQVDKLNAELERVTLGTVTTINQIARMLNYLDARDVKIGGKRVASVDTKHVGYMLRQKELPSDCRRMLEIRKELGRSSIGKFKKAIECVESDGRLRGTFLYHGASTGRWAGKYIQPHNFVRKGLREDLTEHCIDCIKRGDVETLQLLYGSIGAVLKCVLRGLIIAGEGKRLLWADYSQIEARGVAWLAGQQSLLDQFAENAPVYEIMAGKIYGCSYRDVSEEQRNLGKACILGAGYQMGAGTFHATCKAWGMEVSKDLAAHAIKTYREENPKIVQLWYGLNDASLEAVEHPGTITTYRKLAFSVRKGFLWMRLPSGRRIAYYRPDIRERAVPSPPFPAGTTKPTVHFLGTEGKAQATLQSTYGGKLTENATQGACRDLLASAMLRLEAAGYPVVLHVHDEAVTEVPYGHGSIDEVLEIMNDSPTWADGLPVASDGKEGKRYRK